MPIISPCALEISEHQQIHKVLPTTRLYLVGHSKANRSEPPEHRAKPLPYLWCSVQTWQANIKTKPIFVYMHTRAVDQQHNSHLICQFSRNQGTPELMGPQISSIWSKSGEVLSEPPTESCPPTYRDGPTAVSVSSP